MSTNETLSLVLALLTALAAGLIGSFALMKRMSLAGDVISHIALPGLGIAMIIKVDPLIGAAVALFLGSLLIWRLESGGRFTTDVAIGVIFTAALAIGTLVTPSEDLIEALFGGFEELTFAWFVLGIVCVAAIIAFVWFYRHELIICLFSRDLAITSGIDVSRVNLYFLMMFSLTVLLGLRFLGSLLVGALIIIPAAIGRQLTQTLVSFLCASAAASVISVLMGFFIHRISPTFIVGPVKLNLAIGPAIISVAAAIFVISLLKKKS